MLHEPHTLSLSHSAGSKEQYNKAVQQQYDSATSYRRDASAQRLKATTQGRNHQLQPILHLHTEQQLQQQQQQQTDARDPH
jgi:hypothetical protein